MSDLTEQITHFVSDGTLISQTTIHGGLINATFHVIVEKNNTREELILQRVNCDVFPHPERVMANIRLVTEELKRIAPDQCHLTLRRTTAGDPYWTDDNGHIWRAFDYIKNSTAFEAVTSSTLAYQAGKAFGQFLKLLANIDANQLAITIPDFHNTPSRYRALERAITEDKANRAEHARAELDFIHVRRASLSKIEALRISGDLPTRVTHNDTKISNVLFDQTTEDALCVIDLDTIMPGTMLYDFGDLVRTSLTPENEDPVSQLHTLDLDRFRELTKGYLTEAGDLLTDTELANLVFSAQLITLELAIRFLTDYLDGDTYFKTTSPDQNLLRTRAQLHLVTLLETHENEMEFIVREIVRKSL